MYSPEVCDCIGMESCADFASDVECTRRWGGGIRGAARRRAAGREYPPPIQRRVNVTRYATPDGRLIVREEKIQRQEYFQAERSNGRLVLRLVNIIDRDDDDARDDEEGKEEEGGRVRDLTAVVDSSVYYGRGVNNCGGFTATVETVPLRSPLRT